MSEFKDVRSGAGEVRWYVATVKSCQERRIADRLSERGIQAYVPVQKVRRKWSDRVKTVDRLLIPGMVFIRCDEKTRLSLFEWLYGIAYFLMDRSRQVHTPLVIPERQMEDFMRVARAYSADPELTVTEQKIAPGDTVRVIRGPLEGFVFECVNIRGQHKIIIRMGSVGSLLATISVADVLKI